MSSKRYKPYIKKEDKYGKIVKYCGKLGYIVIGCNLSNKKYPIYVQCILCKDLKKSTFYTLLECCKI